MFWLSNPTCPLNSLNNKESPFPIISTAKFNHIYYKKIVSYLWNLGGWRNECWLAGGPWMLRETLLLPGHVEPPWLASSMQSPYCSVECHLVQENVCGTPRMPCHTKKITHTETLNTKYPNLWQKVIQLHNKHYTTREKKKEIFWDKPVKIQSR